MKFNVNARALGPVAAAVMLVCAVSSVQAAGDDDSPFSLKLSETVSYDTNYSRTTNNKQKEVISSTAVEVGMNKPYGRQTYTGSGRFAIDRHKNFENQDNQNYDVDLGFSTGIASNWSLSASGAASENLNPNQNNAFGDRLAKNIRSHSDVGLNIQYGLSGRWAVVGSAATARTSYSLASSRYQNQQQASGGLRLVYNTSDLLNFAVGGTYVNSEYPERLVNGVPEEIRQRNINFSTNWQVTGFSSLYALLSFSHNQYKSDPEAKYNGVTGQLSWNFTPSGLTSYALTISRSTDSDDTSTSKITGAIIETGIVDGKKVGPPVDLFYKNLTTSIGGSMRWTPTAKIGVNAGVNYSSYRVSRTNNVNDPEFRRVGTIAGTTTSNYTVLSLSSDYQYSRAIGLGCSYQHYDQSAESNKNVSYGNPRIAHVGNQYSCNASFKID